MMKCPSFVLFFLSLIHMASAADIAFLIKKTADGHIEILEPNSFYSHVAIRVGDQWLEARPYYGVHLTNDLSGMGTITTLMSDPNVPEPSEEFLNEVLGKKYFVFADWHDPNIFNCTKLVAKYLGIPPNPMEIDLDIWGESFSSYIGKPGLSVSELQNELEDRGFSRSSISSCRKHLL